MPRFFVLVVFAVAGWVVPDAIARQSSPDGLWFIASADPSKFLPPPSEFRSIPGSVSFISMQEASMILLSAPSELAGRAEVGVPFYLPDPNGQYHLFVFVNSPLVVDPNPVTGYATYFGVGLDDLTRRARISLTPRGLHALVIGEPAAYLVERAYSDDATVYTSHYIEDLPAAPRLQQKLDCGRRSAILPENLAAGPYSASQMKLARIAIAVRPAVVSAMDGFDNTKSFVQDLVSDMALVFEIDFGLRLVQVEEPYRSQIIFIDTDPYCDFCDPIAQVPDSFCLTCENRHVLENGVGFSRYDIGHMINYNSIAAFAPGLATHSDTYPLIDCGPTAFETQDQCISNNSTHKARSITSWWNLPNYSSYYWVDHVAHEIAHMLTAEHTFNSPDCNFIPPDAYEPGSGSTIMGYIQQCEPSFVPHADPYFHTATISRVRDFIAASSLPLWPTANAAPVCNAGLDYQIPKLTPFELKAGSASDPNGDALTYCWEQIDLGTGSSDLADKPTGPLFRSYLPTASTARLIPKSYFDPAYLDPNFEMSERLTSYDRDLNFRLTVRDGYGGVAMDSMLVDIVTQTTAGAPVGPFVLTFPNAPMSLNGQITVTWDPANTDAPPISCTNVSIQLARFTNPNPSWETLAVTANDGSATVTLPIVAAPTPARIRVRALSNIFLDAGDANFTLIPPM